MVIKSMKFYVMTWKVDEIVRWILFFAIFFSLQCVCLSFSPHNTHSIWHITSLTEMMNFNKAKQKKKVWINTHCLLRILPPIWITKHIINELFRRNKFQSIWKCSKCYGTYHSIRYDSGQCRYYCVLFLFGNGLNSTYCALCDIESCMWTIYKLFSLSIISIRKSHYLDC